MERNSSLSISNGPMNRVISLVKNTHGCKLKHLDDLAHIRVASISRKQTRSLAIFGALLLAGLLTYGQQPTRLQASSLQQQMRQAVSAAEHGDVTQALTLTNVILTAHSDFSPALKLQGMLLEQSGNNDAAAAAFQKALKQSPNDPELLYRVGVYKLVSGDPDEAITLLEHHLKLQPSDSDTLFYLAQAYHLNGNNEKTIKTIEACLKLDPNNPSVWQKYGELLCSSGDNDRGLEWLQKAQRADPTLERLNYDLGVASYNSMNFPEAVKYAQLASQAHPNDTNSRSLLASSELKLSQWSEAKADFERLLSTNKDDAASLLALGHCQLELKEFQLSIDTLQRLLQLDPTQILAHFYLARAYMGSGQTEEAKHESDLHKHLMEQASFTRSGEGGDNAKEKAIRAQARQLLVDQHEDQALKLFQENARGASATAGGLYVLVGSLYLSMGNQEDANRSLNKALQIEPKVRGAHTYLGIQALLQGDLNRAESEFNAELANDPSYATATAELGEVRYRQQRYAEAADLLIRSRTAIPALMFLLTDAEFHLNRMSEADLTAETLATYAHNNKDLMHGLINLLKRNQQIELAQRLEANLVQ